MKFIHIYLLNNIFNYSAIKFVLVYFRLTKLEKKVFVENGEMPSLVLELQKKVEDFKDKLQVVWVFYKKMYLCTTACSCNRLFRQQI